jgi:hypothetical protein
MTHPLRAQVLSILERYLPAAETHPESWLCQLANAICTLYQPQKVWCAHIEWYLDAWWVREHDYADGTTSPRRQVFPCDTVCPICSTARPTEGR